MTRGVLQRSVETTGFSEPSKRLYDQCMNLEQGSSNNYKAWIDGGNLGGVHERLEKLLAFTLPLTSPSGCTGVFETGFSFFSQCPLLKGIRRERASGTCVNKFDVRAASNSIVLHAYFSKLVRTTKNPK